jgi:ABC-type branched-subunit amino acid transport system permease subunit
LFLILTVTQIGHLAEHVAQMTQRHVLGLPCHLARGVVSQLDIEWVHFLWNAWVLIGVMLLLPAFRRNGWLWATAVVAAWHTVEHVAIMAQFLTTGTEGGPGLLSRGGLIMGGVDLKRMDLHFVYNLLGTAPLLVAFAIQLREAEILPVTVRKTASPGPPCNAGVTPPR